jgi:predicted dinucleotide-binding enzyme
VPKRIGIVGSGMVARTLAAGFIKYGQPVMVGSGNAAKLKVMAAQIAGIAIGSFEDAANFGEIVVLAVKGTAAEVVVRSLGTRLNGKTVLDTTNPIADAPPVNGVIPYFTDLNESLMERLQTIAPGAHFVKAFSCIGNALMVNPDFAGVKPTMFICGNNGEAKAEARQILEQFGFEVQDMGTVEAARAIEPLAILWCIPGLRENRWTHALKLLRL